MSFKYVGSPYSDPDPLIMQERFEAAEKYVAEALMRGEHVYSPIVHCHEMAVKYNLPRDFEFWQSYNRAMLSTAAEFVVLRLDGWEGSTGLKGEADFADSCGIVTTYE